MEETQAIDFADFPSEDDFAPAADIGTDQVRRSPTEESFGRSRFTVPYSRICWLFQVVGALEVASQPADSFPLHLGEVYCLQVSFNAPFSKSKVGAQPCTVSCQTSVVACRLECCGTRKQQSSRPPGVAR